MFPKEMGSSDHFDNFYSCTEIEVLRIKNFLEGEEILSIVRRNHRSGNLGGFFEVTPTTVFLKMREADLDKGRTLIEDINQNK